ncbi:MAG: hypothetical protein M1377_08540 [Deltaproteobacteria bacterium]|nr:hypothetical protein [Deltaproteobacteria bacterium]
MKRNGGLVPIFLMLCIAILLSSCGKTIYRYKNVAYESPEMGLAAQREDLEAIIQKVDVASTHVGGVAIVLLPSNAYVTENFVNWSGPLSEEQKAKMGGYIAQSLLNTLRANGDGLEKSRLFDKVVYGTSDTSDNVPFREDVAIYVKAENRKPLWFLRKKEKPDDSVPIEPVSTSLPPVMRMNLWIKNVEQAVRTQ